MKESCTWKTNLRRIDQKKSGDVVIFGDSITNVSRYQKTIFNQKIQNLRFKNFPGALSPGSMHHINPTLEESELNVVFIQVGVNEVISTKSTIFRYANVDGIRNHLY